MLWRIMRSLSYKLFGNPVSHSLSPQIHTLFAQQFDLTLSYTTQKVETEDFLNALEQFRIQGGRGANITVPLKEIAYTLCQHKSTQAQRAQAVNTLYWDKDNQLCGDNTDGIGLVKDLKNNYHQILENKNILILGAGGAARGIIPALLDENPKRIYISNRTPLRAKDLIKDFNTPKLELLAYEKLNEPLEISFDFIINATSLSLEHKSLPLHPSIMKDHFAYDFVYNLEYPTAFIQQAREHKAKQAHDGLGMLIEQAAESFYLWHQKKPNTQPVYLFFRKNSKGLLI